MVKALNRNIENVDYRFWGGQWYPPKEAETYWLCSQSVLFLCLLIPLFTLNCSGFGDQEKLTHPTYNVNIQTFPISTNDEIKIAPFGISLELHCGNNVQGISGRGYPIEKSFLWSPTDCGKAYLSIYVGERILKKTYASFPEFLRAFSDRHKLYANEFSPDELKFLKHNLIEYFEIHFGFSGDAKTVMRFRK
jgi:hypothetical protein